VRMAPSAGRIASVLGAVLTDTAHYGRAIEELSEALRLSSDAGDGTQVAFTLGMLGRAHLLRDELDATGEAFDESLACARRENWTAFTPWPRRCAGMSTSPAEQPTPPASATSMPSRSPASSAIPVGKGSPRAGSVSPPPRGVAVNGAGTVVTTLPTPNIRLDVVDLPYTFSSGFPETGAAPRIALGGRDLASRGMATDAAGNFYVTGFIGSTICGRDAAGAIIVLSPNGAAGLCHPFSPTPVNMQDVAVGPPAAPNVLSTLLGYPGQILGWGRLAVPSEVPSEVAPVAAPDVVAAALRKDLTAAARRLRRRGLRRLLRGGGFTVTGFDAQGAGRLLVRLRMGRTIVAKGSRRLARTGRYRVRVKLTQAGRRRLRTARRPRLVLSFRLKTAGRTLNASQAVVVRR
jgi:hypothetical protein